MDHPQLPPERILFEDHHLLVANKPAPLLTQAPFHLPSLEAQVKAYIKAKYDKPGGVYLGIPHRLDRPVSGVVAFARNTKAAQRVHAQFQHRKVRKVYWAMVEGVVLAESGIWEDWIFKVPEESRTERADATTPGAKQAELAFRVLKRFENRTLLKLAPHTGRMHQLRAQSAWRGHPILGDAAYGSTCEFGPPAELPRDRVIALHARHLSLKHPFRDETLTFLAPLPPYWGPIEVDPESAEPGHFT